MSSKFLKRTEIPAKAFFISYGGTAIYHFFTPYRRVKGTILASDPEPVEPPAEPGTEDLTDDGKGGPIIPPPTGPIPPPVQP